MSETMSKSDNNFKVSNSKRQTSKSDMTSNFQASRLGMVSGFEALRFLGIEAFGLRVP